MGFMKRRKQPHLFREKADDKVRREDTEGAKPEEKPRVKVPPKKASKKSSKRR